MSALSSETINLMNTASITILQKWTITITYCVGCECVWVGGGDSVQVFVAEKKSKLLYCPFLHTRVDSLHFVVQVQWKQKWFFFPSIGTFFNISLSLSLTHTTFLLSSSAKIILEKLPPSNTKLKLINPVLWGLNPIIFSCLQNFKCP